MRTVDEWVGTFAERIAELREKQHRSRKVVSELCGLSPDAFRRYERREAKPSVDAVLAIANYFEVSTDYLMGRIDYKF